MRYDEIRKLIIGSSPDDWAVVESGGEVYLDRFEEHVFGGESRLSVAGHNRLAVYKDDVDLRLAWGMTVETGLKFRGWEFGAIERQRVDGFWRSALVTRWPVLRVDGGRCYLPSPQPAVVSAGTGRRDHIVTGWTVGESGVALARLLQLLVRPGGGTDFDSYLRESGAVIVSDQGPG